MTDHTLCSQEPGNAIGIYYTHLCASTLSSAKYMPMNRYVKIYVRCKAQILHNYSPYGRPGGCGQV